MFIEHKVVKVLQSLCTCSNIMVYPLKQLTFGIAKLFSFRLNAGAWEVKRTRVLKRSLRVGGAIPPLPLNKRKEGKTMRKPVVSRTFKILKVTCLCVNTVTQETEEYTVELSRPYKTEKAIIRQVKKHLGDCTSLIPVSIVSQEVEPVKLEMDEADFLKYARVAGREPEREIGETPVVR